MLVKYLSIEATNICVIRSENVFYFWYNIDIPMESNISYFLGTIAALCRKNEWWRFGGEVEKIWQCSYNHKAGNYVANTNYIAIFLYLI